MTKWNIEALAELARGFESKDWERVSRAAEVENEFFDADNIAYAVDAIKCQMIDKEKLSRWLSAYFLPRGDAKRVGIVMAGNIPMVGFFDLLCVVAAGHKASVKLSSKDSAMMGYVTQVMVGAGFDVEVVDRLDRYDVDAVIVTGSDEAVAFYRSEFKGLPAIFRGSRHSVAVVDRAWDVNERLVDDMFRYWGLGCRNVTHLLIDRRVNMADMVARFADIAQGSKYLKFGVFSDSYRYSKAVSSMMDSSAHDCGYFILKQSDLYKMPNLAQVDYSFYDNRSELDSIIKTHGTILQCVSIAPYGQCQCPELWQYADGVDVMEFLLNLYQESD